MGETLRLNMNPDGSLNDPDAPSVQTKADYDANPVTGGAQIGHVRLQGEESVQRVQVGGDLADQQKYADLMARTNAYDAEVQRVAHLEAAGRPVSQSTREHLLREYQDIYIGWRGFGIDIEQS